MRKKIELMCENLKIRKRRLSADRVISGWCIIRCTHNPASIRIRRYTAGRQYPQPGGGNYCRQNDVTVTTCIVIALILDVTPKYESASNTSSVCAYNFGCVYAPELYQFGTT